MSGRLELEDDEQREPEESPYYVAPTQGWRCPNDRAGVPMEFPEHPNTDAP